MYTLRAAVIGTGFMGRTHVEALRRIGVTVVGLLDASPKRGQAAVQQLGVPRCYETLEQLTRDSMVDTVHICTPNHLHCSMARAALAAGKHVIVEKPLAISSLESSGLVHLAQEMHRAAAVNYNMRYYPLCHEARARVQAGLLGQVWLVHGSYLQDWLCLPTDWNWRLEPHLGGDLRAVADIGTHWLDLVTWIIARRVISVDADFATCLSVRQKPHQEAETFAGKLAQAEHTEPVSVHTEDYATVVLRFEDSIHGVVTVSQVSAGRKNRLFFEIDGSRAALTWDSENPNELWVGHRESANEVLIKDPALLASEARSIAGYPGGHAEGYQDTFVGLFRAFYDYVTAGDMTARPTFPTFEDGHAQIVLCEAVAQSVREGRRVSVPRLSLS